MHLFKPAILVPARRLRVRPLMATNWQMVVPLSMLRWILPVWVTRPWRCWICSASALLRMRTR